MACSTPPGSCATSGIRPQARRDLRLRALSESQSQLQQALRTTQEATEVLQLVTDQKHQLNSTLASTAVQKLAYLPTSYISFDDLNAAVEELAAAAACNLATMPDPTATLWGFAELNIRSPAVQDLLEVFASDCWSQQQQQTSSKGSSRRAAQPDQWNTVVWAYHQNSNEACKNLVTVVWAFGRLARNPSPHIVGCMSSIAAELSKKLHNNQLKDAFSPQDLADIVDAFASFLDHSESQAAWAQSFSQRNVGALLDTIASDVRHQLSNKHSMRAAFDPKSLVKLLSGYARLQHISSASSGMLDAAAGFVVRRMTAGHLNAVTKPADLAQLLHAYAALGHSTVVVPELLIAASNQLRKQLASDLERQSQLGCEAEAEQGRHVKQGSWLEPAKSAADPLHLISILASYQTLGYHPSQGLLTAAEPFLTGGSEPLPLQQALELTSLFASFHWQTGNLILEQVASTLLLASHKADVNTLAQITSGLMQLHALGHRISEAQLEQLQNRQQQLKASRNA